MGMKSKLDQIQNWEELAREVKWSASALAKKTGVSLRTLERYFIKKSGQCPKSWLTEKRQHLAIELLQDNCAVKVVAADLGYKDATHFSRGFKAYWEYCPTAKPLLPELG